MKIVTFYSFKGGVGRSTALANVAYLLANAGYRVAAVDFDVEAPGLHFVFDIPPGAIRTVLQEYLSAPDHFGRPDQFSRAFVDVGTARGYVFENAKGVLRLLPAGIRPDLNDALIVDLDLFMTVQALYDRIERYVSPDVLLVDSRSGISSLALPAQMQSDAVVLLFRLGRQQMIGTENTVEWLTERFTQQRGAPVPLLLCASNIPSKHRGDGHQREMNGLATDLSRLSGNPDVDFVTTVFRSELLSEGERIVVDEPHRDDTLFASYSRLASHIARRIGLLEG